ncbi:pseudaminic acid synthase, partial [Vibrio vulnificus]|nr:pseudaminic acid synthase [Vibrio vulnificus]
GNVNYERTEAEKGNVKFRRSLYVVKDVAEGEILTSENVRSIRPGFGLAPKHYEAILGKKAKQNIMRGTPLTFDVIETVK